jgi:hypothetical protein
MGQAILYCYRCSTQLRDAQFEAGKAYRVDSWAICAPCAPEALKTLPPETVQKLQDLLSGKTKKPAAVANRKTGYGLPSVREPLRESSRAMSVTGSSTVTSSVPKPPRNPWVFVGIVGGIILLLVIVMISQGGKKDVRDPDPGPSPGAGPGIPPGPRPSPVETPAQAALKRAAKYAQDYPDDLDGQIQAYDDLTLKEDKGEWGTEARRKVEALKARDNDNVARALQTLNQEITPLLREEQYGDALRTIEANKYRLSTSGRLAFEKRASEIRDQQQAAMKKAAALAVPQQPAKLPVTPVIAPPPVAVVRSAEAKSFDPKWEKILARASARDYAGAAAELEKEAAALKEPELKAEIAKDVADLKDLDRVYQATLAAAKSVRGLDLGVAAGRVLNADADRVELFLEPKKPTVFVEWADVRAAAFLPLLQSQSSDARLAALFAVLDGDASASKEGLAPKYASFKAAPAKASAEELAARELYYAAERDWRTMESREKSVEAYKALKAKYAATSVVKHNQARIDRRGDSGREYLFLTPDFSFAGTFAPIKEERVESVTDSDPNQANKNWVEWEYAPLPNATYHCWILVGACCAETFTFYWQATGLTDVNPKTKKRVPADPGSDIAVQTRPPVKGLKPTHGKDEPKKPSRWEWMELPIPKVSAPGTRRVRLMTDQRGFALSTVIVSTTRTKPPSEAELAELVKTRALDATPTWASDRAGNSVRILIDDFETTGGTWVWVGGWEFPGAKGSYSLDPGTGHDSKASGKIIADFTGGGAYVGIWRDLTKFSNRNFKEIRFWVKTPSVKSIGIRVADSSDQIHQRHYNLKATADWQEFVLKPGGLGKGEHWGGANDDNWHGPIKGFGINIGRDSFSGTNKGEFWLDDVEGLLDTEDGTK